MAGKNTIRRRYAVLATFAVVLLTAVPAAAQFFPWFQPYPQRQAPQYQERREQQTDYSKAPNPKKPETSPTTTIVVMGDSMADWLAYGLEEAFADTPEIGILRKNKPYSGLIRYDSKNDLEWSSVARDIMNNDKPAIAVMMLGLSDRGPIREKAGAKPAPAHQEPAAQPEPDAEADTQIMAPEPPKGRGSSNEFKSEVWGDLYSKKIADTIAAMKSRGVPVVWVGLPIIRGPKATSDAAYLDDLYRAAAEKAGAIYVDVWDAFVDENGKFSSFGPDVEGQNRRLRSNDGVYFTKYGARKLAHYVEREINRVIASRALPVSLPVDPQPAQPRPSGPVARPIKGPIVPLTSHAVSGGDELLGSGRERSTPSDPIASRVLVKGEPVSPLKGRADDFVWPGGTGGTLPVANTIQEPGTIKPVEVPAEGATAESDQKAKAEAQAANQQKKPRSTQQREVQRPPPAAEQPRFRSPFGFLFGR
jgi:hypothetical protein